MRSITEGSTRRTQRIGSVLKLCALRGKQIQPEEIKKYHRDHPNRYNAFGAIPPNKKIRVVYTLVEQPDGTTVVVITAFED